MRAVVTATAAPVLAGIQAFFGVVMALFAVFPPLPVTPRAVFLALSAACFLLAVLTLIGARRLTPGWLGFSAAATGLVFAVVTAAVSTPQGQVGAGMALALPAVFVAQYAARRLLGVLLAVMIGAWAVALAVNPVLPGAPVWVAAIAGLVVLVSMQVHGLERQLRFDAEHDALTGSLNRLGLEARGRVVGGIAARAGIPVSVALIDLDGFKVFNDTHGHRAGDELLCDLVAHWRAQLRAGDLLARYGGDEFALVLPGTAPPEADVLLARLSSAAPGAWSAGVASWQPGESVYDALARADRNLYLAKGGRPGTADGQTTP